MKSWQLNKVTDLRTDAAPLKSAETPVPVPNGNEILIRISCCGVCHTELDEIEGRVAAPSYPIIPGHQVVGRVEKRGPDAVHFNLGDRVGVAWIGGACGQCDHCRSGHENLCEKFRATGRDIQGGYAEFMTIDERFAFSIPAVFSDVEAAPLLCAGAIGYRSLQLAGINNGQALGLMGFGASAHIVLKLSKYLFPASPILVFARSAEERAFAITLGAMWAGRAEDQPPQKARAIIDTTPSWNAVVWSLEHLEKGGRLVINAIRKEESDKTALLHLKYPEHLWMEKEIKSVANITRSDVSEFFRIAAEMPLIPEVQSYPFSEANIALVELKNKHVMGAKVLRW